MKNGNKQREKRRGYARELWNNQRNKSICPQCMGQGFHFVPPSLGEEGFFTCEKT